MSLNHSGFRAAQKMVNWASQKKTPPFGSGFKGPPPVATSQDGDSMCFLMFSVSLSPGL